MSRSSSKNHQGRLDRRLMHKRIRQSVRRVLGGGRARDPHVGMGVWKLGKYRREVPDNETLDGE